MIAINLKGVFLSMRHEIAAMLKTGAARSSQPPASPASSESRPVELLRGKHGVAGLTRPPPRLYRQEHSHQCVCPARREPPLEAWFQDPAVESHVMSLHPIGRLAAPQEVARVALFLASPESSFMVGSRFLSTAASPPISVWPRPKASVRPLLPARCEVGSHLIEHCRRRSGETGV